MSRVEPLLLLYIGDGTIIWAIRGLQFALQPPTAALLCMIGCKFINAARPVPSHNSSLQAVDWFGRGRGFSVRVYSIDNAMLDKCPMEC